MRISIASISENGDRPYNEDSLGYLQHDSGCLLALADGLGGHGKGEVASQTAIQAVKDVYQSAPNDIAKMFQEAQDRVIAMQNEAGDTFSMKTTLVSAAVNGNTIRWGHIGDSRLYFFRDGKLTERTLDHSVPQMLVNAGEIREKDIRGHIDRNKLLRVRGMEWESPRYQLSDEKSFSGTIQLLLCSDGFWEYIDEKHMTKLLKKSSTPEEWLSAMKEEVLANGADSNMDNFSAICAFIEV